MLAVLVAAVQGGRSQQSVLDAGWELLTTSPSTLYSKQTFSGSSSTGPARRRRQTSQLPCSHQEEEHRALVTPLDRKDRQGCQVDPVQPLPSPRFSCLTVN